MTERPWELLAHADTPRPLPPALREALETLLLYGDSEADGLTYAPVAGLSHIDAPRVLPDLVRDRLQAALPGPARRRAAGAAWVAAVAAAVAVLLVSVPLALRSAHHDDADVADRALPSPSSSQATAGTGSGLTGSQPTGVSPAQGTTGLAFRPSGTPTPASTGLGDRGAAAAAGPVPTPAATGRPPAPQVTGLSPASGSMSGGTWVTVTGAALSNATAVTFGPGAPAQRIEVVSGTELRALSPGHLPGPVDVQVTTPGGTSAASNGSRYVYLP
jgi:hypothetical protein